MERRYNQSLATLRRWARNHEYAAAEVSVLAYTQQDIDSENKDYRAWLEESSESSEGSPENAEEAEAVETSGGSEEESSSGEKGEDSSSEGSGSEFQPSGSPAGPSGEVPPGVLSAEEEGNLVSEAAHLSMEIAPVPLVAEQEVEMDVDRSMEDVNAEEEPEVAVEEPVLRKRSVRIESQRAVRDSQVRKSLLSLRIMLTYLVSRMLVPTARSAARSAMLLPMGPRAITVVAGRCGAR